MKATNRKKAFLRKPNTGCSLTDDLVTQWNVSVADARTAYRQWMDAVKKRHTLKKAGTHSEETIAQQLQMIFWWTIALDGASLPQQLHEFADVVADFEKEGANISKQDLAVIMTEPTVPDADTFRDWLVLHWIMPVQIGAKKIPLCVCASTLIVHLYTRQTGICKEDTGSSVRDDLGALGLLRLSSFPEIRMKKFEQILKGA